VVVTAGYRNRFGHPKQAIVARYLEAGARVWRTDRDGAVTVRIDPDGVRVERFRDERPRYWR
jgi:competence protein ComEC